ncbi:MFS transporter [Tessaracoccus sp. ZS01]|uniref:MFS transporter n=1 Tax=Tessaracoccus sp. ZS01 TaxID=1906324 RepID=UPI00096E732E|nr:MFS transporter [Tessaracoccus sp. ZS01]MCG6568374.1 MFS transporter [Tessaracoccus sp. ZS01]OMG52782.1 MFS transporter [Tessaracoccus sp. ZS01]
MSSSMVTVLRNPRFARFYGAQSVSQLGDAILWVALALVAVELEGPAQAPVVVAIALTLRVAAFVALGPVAGVVADRVDRRLLLAGCHVGRMVAVGLMFWVTAPWQVYVLMVVANGFTAFFTPANQATVPLVAGPLHARAAFALSAATTEVFGIVGPGLGGLAALGLGGRSLFLVIGGLFGLAAFLVLTLGPIRVKHHEVSTTTWTDVRDGTSRLWRDGHIRFALLAELVAAISGALVLTVTVARVQDGLGLTDAHFGWVMAAYGLGATLASLAVAHLVGVSLVRWIAVGAVLTSVAVLPADLTPYAGLVALWAMAGVGQNWVNLPTETLIAERTPASAQGRVYGAHFAWSHLWWGLTYPLAGALAALFVGRTFLAGGLIAVAVAAVVLLAHRRILRRDS